MNVHRNAKKETLTEDDKFAFPHMAQGLNTIELTPHAHQMIFIR